jgi:hypothetical protein
MSKLILMAISTVLLAACATPRAAAPPPAPAPRPEPRQYDGPPPAPPSAPSVSARLSFDLPAGWVQAPPDTVPDGVAGVILNPATRGMIMVIIEANPSGTPASTAAALRQQLADGGWTCSDVAAPGDGSTASFTTSKDAMRGKVAIKRLTAGAASADLGLMGMWPEPNDAAMSADYDAVLSSARLVEAPAGSGASAPSAPSTIDL